MMMFKENSQVLPSKRTRSITPSIIRKPLKALFQNQSVVLDDPDLKDVENPQILGIYAYEIFDNLFRIEKKFMTSPSYMDLHTEVNYKMRAILID